MASHVFKIEKKPDRTTHEFELHLPPLPVAEDAAPKRPARARAKAAAEPDPEPTERVEKFRVHGSIPAWIIIEAEALSRTTATDAAVRYMAFFDAAIIDEDQVRWRRVVRDPANQIDAEEIGAVFRWLYEVYAERPSSSA